MSSVLLDKPKNMTFMVITAMMLILSLSLDHKFPWLKPIQFIFLGAFHYFSQLNWCVLLYYITIINLVGQKIRFRDTAPIALLLTLQYSIIRLTYVPISTYNMLVSAFDAISSIVVILVFHVTLRIESERRELTKRHEYLINYDPITGFHNYLGYIKKVQHTIDSNREFLFVLFDINNFKSLKAEGTSTANDILISFSMSLKEHFPTHLAACRYAGDRFSLLLSSTERIDDLQIFEKLGFQVTFSITHSPQEGNTFEELIQIGEERIFQIRRDYWVKRQEEQLRSDKMRIVGELAAGMAHEIRNPLTAIKGFIQLSRTTGYNIQPWYEVIMGEITRVGELTVEFLQFSKPHVSNMKIEMMATCMERVYSLCESEATSYGHIIEMDATNQDIMVVMDRDKIIQVLINLIRNAFQAMEGPGHVHFILSKEREMSIIQIRDNGTGIPASELHKIFDAFYTTKEEGTGLGLSLCQKIIEDHNGQITVESEVGSGTMFTIKLPIYVNIVV
ncbi:ATP-binding protein [Paenibacillus sp. FA6]|uniref:ATP-binding protein n=1 Tax=Paenibacillus sp. FA6 TaxID=3413029 RepID=UPI003F656DD0